MNIEHTIGSAFLGRVLLAIGETPADLPFWVTALRELGSFGLIGFIVWWYATRVAPKSEANFLTALALQRSDYVTASSAARADFLRDRREDRDSMKALAFSMDSLAKVVLESNRQAVESNRQALESNRQGIQNHRSDSR